METPFAIELTRAFTPADIRRTIPAATGLYAWWLREPDLLPGIAGDVHPGEDWRLLFVGIAPQRAKMPATLRSRVVEQDLDGSLASSAFRRSLAALLFEHEGWTPQLDGDDKLALGDEDNAALTRWQEEHLALGWIGVRQPWTFESQLVREMRPALNDTSGEPLVSARSRLTAAARAAA